MTDKNTREILLKVAINLFYQKGYSNTSIREIGAKTNISSSIIYHYFKDKEEMLFEIITTATNDLISSLKDAVSRITDPERRLREMLRVHIVDFGLKRRKESKIVVSEDHCLRGKHQQHIVEAEREIYLMYRKNLEELMESGQLKNIDLTVINFGIFGMINLFFRWYREGGRLTRDEVAQNIMDFIWHGIFRE